MGFFWTRAKVNELILRWTHKERVAVIAAKLGCTRNMVIGKANRLGLEPYTAAEINRNLKAAWTQEARARQAMRVSASWRQRRRLVRYQNQASI